MFSLFKRKKYPEFYNSYLKSFKTDTPKTFEETRFVVFDTETTGLEIQSDKILSIGAVAIKNGIIDVSDSFEVYLEQDKFNSDTVEIHGLLKDGKLEKYFEHEAIEYFLKYIQNSVLVAHHAAFDITMINQALKNLNLPILKNKSIDTGILYKKLEGKKDGHFNLDKLCDEFNIPKHDRHTASGDAFITAILLLKIYSRLKSERTVHYSDLFRNSNQKGLI